MIRRSRTVLTLLVLIGLAPRLAAQATGQDALRVFLDCQGGNCDFNYFRTEITWVNWVRDRTDAQVHVLVTTQSTGGGGREYTLRFLGLKDFQGRDEELKHAVQAVATDDDERAGVAHALRLGLVAYAARSPLAPRLDVSYRDSTSHGELLAQQPDDPWNYWVFRAEVSGFLSGESRSNSTNLEGSLRATRVTDDWKLRFNARAARSSNDFTFDDGSTFESELFGASASALVARSISDHWTVGVTAGARTSDRQNFDLAAGGAPGIEYNVFPYQESTRRQLTFLYEVGATAYNYTDSTIYDRTEETIPSMALTASLVTRQPWGWTDLSLRGGVLLDDLDQNRLVLNGGLEVRIVKGLSVNFDGSYSRIRDQRNIAKGGATDEEVLLRLRQLQTSYEYFIAMGLSYTFGSIYNNIVNPRFGRAGSTGSFEF
jgi:hypothetical protein